MSDEEFTKLLEEQVNSAFHVAEFIESLRQKRDALRDALRGDAQGMPAALRRSGAEGATEEERGFNAFQRRRDLEAWTRYQELRRAIALVNRLEALIRAQVPEDLKDLKASWMATRESST